LQAIRQAVEFRRIGLKHWVFACLSGFDCGKPFQCCGKNPQRFNQNFGISAHSATGAVK
jgi:hypothetical protein